MNSVEFEIWKCKRSISFCSRELKNCPDYIFDNLKTRIEREKFKLDYYKEEYPEYFI